MYAIYLIPIAFPGGNSYGYYAGSYIFQGEYYPVWDQKVTERTKRYKYKKVAQKSAEKMVFKFGYVRNFEIREVEG